MSIETDVVQRPHSSGVLCGSFVVCVGDVGVCFRLNHGLSRMPRITRIGGVFYVHLILAPAGRYVCRNASTHILAPAGRHLCRI